MTFTEELFEEVKEIWNSYLAHPFIREIGEGTLPKEKFKNYLIQDYLYLKEYSKVFCIGVVKAETMDEMRFYYKSIKGSMEDETEAHITYLKGFGIDPVEVEDMECDLITTSYTSYMKGIALTGDLKEIAAAILPCTWSYNYIGKYLAENYGGKLEDNFYKEWIDTYASQGFTDFSDAWIEYTDKLCKSLSEAEKKKLKEIFKKSSIYEMQFWDMAYKQS